MKYFITVIFLMLGISSQAQTYKLYQTDNIHNQLRLNTKTGEVYQIQDDGQKFVINYAVTPDNESANRYMLYKTRNIWTFILLDRWTGKLWQCQFSVEGEEYMITIPINTTALSYSAKPIFNIEPMTSMFQFYLINEENGEMWKFQWSTKGDDYRWIEKV